MLSKFQKVTGLTPLESQRLTQYQRGLILELRRLILKLGRLVLELWRLILESYFTQMIIMRTLRLSLER